LFPTLRVHINFGYPIILDIDLKCLKTLFLIKDSINIDMEQKNMLTLQAKLDKMIKAEEKERDGDSSPELEFDECINPIALKLREYTQNKLVNEHGISAEKLGDIFNESERIHGGIVKEKLTKMEQFERLQDVEEIGANMDVYFDMNGLALHISGDNDYSISFELR